MLYAGITSVLNTPSSIDIVKILKQRSQSAGNRLSGTSETLCDEIVENVKSISKHVPTHTKPINDEQFGHYLAGLIDGDGHFNLQKQLVIVFDIQSVSLAYFIKKFIGYGKIKKIKDKNAYIYIVFSIPGLVKVINLINSKIRSKSKFDQINNILKNNNLIINNKPFKINNSTDLENHWLAGFSDADASFQIKLINRKDKTEVRLNYQVDQKTDDLLILIKNYIGGNIGYINSQDTYYYESTSFGSARNIINYFDIYHMLSVKHVNYLKWRKAYLLIQDRKYLDKDGLVRITKLKNTMNRFNSTTI